MDFKYKNQLVNIFIIILGLIVASNIYKTQDKIMQTLKTEKEEAVKKSGILGEIKQLEKKINVYKKYLTKKDPLILTNNINNFAQESGVKIISVRPEGEIEYPAYIQYSFSLVISASDYHKIGSFISKLENSVDIYIIESLNIESSNFLRSTEQTEARQIEAGQTEEINATLVLSTIFFKG
ncbi:MAG: type 4a pilus biogenesis protein PilO [Candidatus Omnitrophica bacterium]|nr:type 4a pilus biogenesis protein PilO [Candidatus Omnitrophota bacterium]